jgi:hypothetical protein
VQFHPCVRRRSRVGGTRHPLGVEDERKGGQEGPQIVDERGTCEDEGAQTSQVQERGGVVVVSLLCGTDIFVRQESGNQGVQEVDVVQWRRHRAGESLTILLCRVGIGGWDLIF